MKVSDVVFPHKLLIVITKSSVKYSYVMVLNLFTFTGV